MVSKTRNRKRIDPAFMIIIIICLVVGGSVFLNTITGMAVNRNMISFNERICPNPEKPIPVFVDEVGRMGNTRIVKCLPKGEAIENFGGQFVDTRIAGQDLINIPEKKRPYFPGYPLK